MSDISLTAVRRGDARHADIGREERDEQVISLGLHIVRNLLSIKDVVASDMATGNQQEFAHLQVRLAFPFNIISRSTMVH